MTKILYISEYRNATHRGECSIEYMRSLLSVGAEVIARPFIINDNLVEPPDDIRRLEDSKSSGITHIIQDVDTEHYDEYGGYQNIRLHSTLLPYDLNAISDNNSRLQLPAQVLGDYLFYWMGTLDRKDNLITVLRAFHQTFPSHKRAQLVLNITKQGNPNQIIDETVNFCNSVKQGMGLHTNVTDYKTEVIVPGILSKDHKNALHNTCNCLMNIGLWGDEYDREWLTAIHKKNKVIRNEIHWDLEPSFNADGKNALSKIYNYNQICQAMWNSYVNINNGPVYDLQPHSYNNIGKRILGYFNE